MNHRKTGWAPEEAMPSSIDFRNRPSWTCFGAILLAAFVLVQPAHALNATGGNIVTNYTVNGTNYTAHIFLSNGTFEVSGGSVTCNVLVVGGGGGAGGGMASEVYPAGGGGGEVKTTNCTLSGSSSVTIGTGGIGNWNANGGNGTASSLNAISAAGGLGGKDSASSTLCGYGGNSGDGHAGGVRYSTTTTSAGGGGGDSANGAKPVNSTTGGAGGNGTSSSLSGILKYYGGGGGGRASATQGTDGLGGGGDDYGGGGGPSISSGHSGIVIIRYERFLPAIENVALTNLTAASADLVGNLTWTGRTATTVWTFWDTTDHTTNKTWTYSTNFPATDLGAITNTFAGLLSNRTYYFTLMASNATGEVWAQPSLYYTLGHDPVIASGGDIVTNYALNGTNFRAHIFTTVGTTNFTVMDYGNVEVLIVAGGGGGGQTIGGGGGAGGFLYSSSYTLFPGSHTITVGAGGAGAPGGASYPTDGGSKGSNSLLNQLKAYGGGGGGSYNNTANGASAGGSGGGTGAGSLGGPMAGTNGQGYAGGITTTNTNSGAGGGGAGAAGGNATSGVEGAGGVGLSSDLSGTLTFYAGGGGGGARNPNGGGGGAAGDGGGGAGSSAAGANATANTGGGGGGGGYLNAGPTSYAGGNGGSGIVIVRYPAVSPSLENIASTNVINVTAGLIGNLISTGALSTTVWTFWDTNNCTTNKTWTYSTNFVADRLGVFTNYATGLLANHTYYYTSYASNSGGECWAEPVGSFETWGPPSVNNAGGADQIGFTVATLNGTLLDGFGATASCFWGEAPNTLTNMAAVGSVFEGAFSVQLTGLQSSSTYYYQCFVSNDYGTAWAPATNSFTTVAAAPVLYVATNGVTGGDGGSWVAAFTNIQQALDTAVDGDEIRLAGHTFWVTSELSWINAVNVEIRGGWEGIGTPGSNNPALWPTVIRRKRPAVTRLFNVSSVTGTLEHVTIQDGLVSSGDPRYGGGLKIANSSLTLSDCQFVGNVVSGAVAAVYYYGGGLYASGSSMLITNCTFAKNIGYSLEGGGSRVWGGGAMFVGGTAEIVDSTFATNALTGKGHNVGGVDWCYGAGVYSSASTTTTVQNCEFIGNTQYGRGTTGGGQNPRAVLRGGAIFAAGSVYVRDTVIKNQSLYASYVVTDAYSRGGGVYGTGPISLMNVLLMNNSARAVSAGSFGDAIGAEGSLYMTNCTVVKNGVITSGRQGIWVTGASTKKLVNSIVWDNGDDLVGFATNASGVLTNVWNSAVEDGDNEGVQGCFSTDPEFDHGYYLAAGSPCVDAGNDTAGNLGLDEYTTRADGTPDTGTVDLGYHPRSELSPAISDLYVLGTGDNGNGGTGWGDAFRSITKALSVAQDGTYIHIGTGQYTNGVETFPLALTRTGLRLLGTNATTCVVNAAGANQRVITVNSIGEVHIERLSIQGGRNAISNPYLGAGIYAAYSTLTINGCRIENNGIIPTPAEGHIYKGAGVYALSSKLAITNCVIANNTMGNSTGRSVTYYGAGCMIESGEPVEIVDTVFLKNASKGRGYSSIGINAYGGGLYAGVPLTLRNCTFTSNDISGSLGSLQGPGVYANSTLTAVNCVFQGNRGIGENNGGSGGGANPQLYGGGIRAAGALTISESVIKGNRLTALYRGSALGGGIYGGAIKLQNVLLANNYIAASNNYSGGLYGVGALTVTNATVVSNSVVGLLRTAGAVSVRNSVIWGNGNDLAGFPTNAAGVLTNVWYCDIEDGDNVGVQGCVSVNPLFADTTYYHLSSEKGYYAGGYFSGGNWATVGAYSPLLDAGDPSSPYQNEPQPNGGYINMGAYGNSSVASLSPPSMGTVILIR